MRCFNGELLTLRTVVLTILISCMLVNLWFETSSAAKVPRKKHRSRVSKQRQQTTGSIETLPQHELIDDAVRATLRELLTSSREARISAKKRQKRRGGKKVKVKDQQRLSAEDVIISVPNTNNDFVAADSSNGPSKNLPVSRNYLEPRTLGRSAVNSTRPRNKQKRKIKKKVKVKGYSVDGGSSGDAVASQTELNDGIRRRVLSESTNTPRVRSTRKQPKKSNKKVKVKRPIIVHETGFSNEEISLSPETQDGQRGETRKSKTQKKKSTKKVNVTDEIVDASNLDTTNDPDMLQDLPQTESTRTKKKTEKRSGKKTKVKDHTHIGDHPDTRTTESRERPRQKPPKPKKQKTKRVKKVKVKRPPEDVLDSGNVDAIPVRATNGTSSTETRKSKKEKAKSKKKKTKGEKKVKDRDSAGNDDLVREHQTTPTPVLRNETVRAKPKKPKKKDGKKVKVKDAADSDDGDALGQNADDAIPQESRNVPRIKTPKPKKKNTKSSKKVKTEARPVDASDLDNEEAIDTSRKDVMKTKKKKKSKVSNNDMPDEMPDNDATLPTVENNDRTPAPVEDNLHKNRDILNEDLPNQRTDSASESRNMSKKKDKKKKGKKGRVLSTDSSRPITFAASNDVDDDDDVGIVGNIATPVTSDLDGDTGATEAVKKIKQIKDKSKRKQLTDSTAASTSPNDLENTDDVPVSVDNITTTPPTEEARPITMSIKKRRRYKYRQNLKESPVIYTQISPISDTYNEDTSPNDITNDDATSPNDIKNDEATSPNDINNFGDTSHPSTPPTAESPTTTPLTTTTKKPTRPPKPHIIVVIADDMGYNDVGYHTQGTGSVAHTPTINNLALSGVRLENYYVQPTCAPTRASLMTGRYPIRMGLQHGNIERTDPTCLPLHETTLPEKLRELGYAAHAIGKWHLGFSSPRCLPTRRGFDSFLGIVIGQSSHYNYEYKDARALYSNESVEWRLSGQHSSELYTQHAIDLIKTHEKTVHSPIEAPDTYKQFYREQYPGIWEKHQFGSNKQRLKYLALMSSLDVGVKNVTEALKERNMWSDTVFVFTSDNGGRTKYSSSNWPLRGEKNSLWEGGIKGVAFVNSPHLSPEVIGTVQTGLMHVSDWFPTLVEGVAGGVAEGRLPLDGVNMWPTLTEGIESPRWEILHNIDNLKNPMRHRQPTPYPYNQWNLFDYIPFDPETYAALRYNDWKLVTGFHRSNYSRWVPPVESFKPVIPMTAYDDPGIYVRLYDLANDPEEKHNVALQNRHIVWKLLYRLKFHNHNLVMPEYLYNDLAGKPVNVRRPGERLAWRPWRP